MQKLISCRVEQWEIVSLSMAMHDSLLFNYRLRDAYDLHNVIKLH